MFLPCGAIVIMKTPNLRIKQNGRGFDVLCSDWLPVGQRLCGGLE